MKPRPSAFVSKINLKEVHASSISADTPTKLPDRKETSFDWGNQTSGSPSALLSESDAEIKQQSIDLDISEHPESEIYKDEEYDVPFELAVTWPRVLISKLEEKYSTLGMNVPKRDRLHNNFLKALRDFLQADFLKHCPEFSYASNELRLKNYNKWLTSYIQKFFGQTINSDINESQYQGKWEGFQFIFGSFISKETMKQMISSSREKAYFYGLLKCFKNSSQKKLAIMLKNIHLVYLLDYMFKSEKINEVLHLN